VLVTRPAHQSGPLARAIAQAGGEAVLLPAIEIAEPVDPIPLQQALQAVPHASHAIFVSRNAVERGLPALRSHGWPPTLRFAAVGAATARALHAGGIKDVIVPADRFDSEALLDLLPADDVRGRTILLFRGEGGRELLADTLSARDARVVHAICYRRRRPANPDPDVLVRIAHGQLDIAIATSVEILENLVAMMNTSTRERLLAMPLIVVGDRVHTAARTLGFHGKLWIAKRADDDTLLDTLRAWRESQKNL